MKITEFAESRGVKEQTIYKYCQRHRDKFKDHIKKDGDNKLSLDDEAYKILDKVYPHPKPVTIIQGVPEEEHHKQIRERDDKIKELQEEIIRLTRLQADNNLLLGELREKTALIEQRAQIKDDQIERLKADNEKLTEENGQLAKEASSYQRTIFGLYRKIDGGK